MSKFGNDARAVTASSSILLKSLTALMLFENDDYLLTPSNQRGRIDPQIRNGRNVHPYNSAGKHCDLGKVVRVVHTGAWPTCWEADRTCRHQVLLSSC